MKIYFGQAGFIHRRRDRDVGKTFSLETDEDDTDLPTSVTQLDSETPQRSLVKREIVGRNDWMRCGTGVSRHC